MVTESVGVLYEAGNRPNVKGRDANQKRPTFRSPESRVSPLEAWRVILPEPATLSACRTFVLCRVGSIKPTFFARRWEARHPAGAGAPALFIYVIPDVGRGYASSLTPPPWQPRVSFSRTV